MRKRFAALFSFLIVFLMMLNISSVSASSGTQEELSVSATMGWQRSSLYVEEGQIVSIMADGAWTVDYRNFDTVGPEGYSPEEDGKIWQGCKIKSSLPYALLLAKIGGGSLIPVGEGHVFKASRSGWVSLRIHDGSPCLEDNAGSVDAVLYAE